jgi:hypothetical protein
LLFITLFIFIIVHPVDIKPKPKLQFTAVIEHEKTGAPLSMKLQPTASGLAGKMMVICFNFVEVILGFISHVLV